MKVIKHLKHETPEFRLKAFFRDMPLITRILIIAISICTMFLTLFGDGRSANFTYYSFLDARPFPQFILFIIMCLTDFQRQQRYGSIFFTISYLFKIGMLGFIHYIFNYLLFGDNQTQIIEDQQKTQQSLIVSTSYPMLFVMMCAFRDMMARSSEIRYFLIDPFQIKCLFYPIFVCVLLLLMGLRVDFFYALFLAAIFILFSKKLEEGFRTVCIKVDKKVVNEKMMEKGVRLTAQTGDQEIYGGNQVDFVTTSNSIVLQET